MGENKLEYEERWVAYFDILGFRDLVEKQSLGFVLSEYLKVLSMVKKDVGRERAETFAESLVRRKWASDAFLFYTDGDSQGLFTMVESFARSFFIRAIMRRIPLRGCLTVGQFYADESNGIFVGPGLINAHWYAENQDWIGYVLTPEARDKLEKLEAEEERVIDVYQRHFYREHDVPFKQSETRRLLAFKLDTFNKGSSLESAQDYYLWEPLIQMERGAPGGCKRKYQNTKDFVLQSCAELRKLVED
ncbi:MAG: hypothetical protein ACYTE5_02800 [Planctomycetota bacterium]|jgi:hypothetical protein